MTLLGRHIFPRTEDRADGARAKRGTMPYARKVSSIASLAALLTVFTVQSAFAQEAPAQTVSAATTITASPLLPNAAPEISQDFNLQVPASASTRLLDLNLDFNSIGCLVGEQNCLREDAPVDLGFSTSISKKSKKGLDLELVPTASMRFDDESRSAVVGAVVRIGEDLRSKDVASNTWYVFAGADAEALSYSPESAASLTRGEFGLSERVIIGDAQAGVGYRIGSADVSLGYFRREVSTLNDSLGTEGFSKTEDAAALSFTWKR